MTTHRLERPTWRCSCGAGPWPCPTRRAQLLDDYSGELFQLRLLMGSYVADALADIGQPGVPEPVALREQLYGWLPPRQSADRG